MGTAALLGRCWAEVFGPPPSSVFSVDSASIYANLRVSKRRPPGRPGTPPPPAPAADRATLTFHRPPRTPYHTGRSPLSVERPIAVGDNSLADESSQSSFSDNRVNTGLTRRRSSVPTPLRPDGPLTPTPTPTYPGYLWVQALCSTFPDHQGWRPLLQAAERAGLNSANRTGLTADAPDQCLSTVSWSPAHSDDPHGAYTGAYPSRVEVFVVTMEERSSS